MAAGLGFKTFNTGEVLTSADVNGYLMQGVLVFASEAARNAAITSPQEGQFAYTKDNNSLWYYTGSAWVASGATGDIEGVTAGVGISGGGTSGTVTITNSMATAIDAKGDLVAGTGADTFSRLAVGANGTVLTAASGEATGLQWATPAAGGMTVLAGPTSFDTSSQVNISSIPGTYKDLRLVIRQPANATDNERISMRFNNDSNSNRYALGFNGGDNQSFGNQNFFAIPQADNTVIQGIAEFELFDYANTSTFKLCRKSCMTNNATTTSNFNMFVEFSAYNQTGAITEINLFTQAGNIKGTYILYGVS